MRRRRNSPSTIEIELFPFLSVLACTIGSLILLIVVITTQTFSPQKEITIVAQGETGKNIAKTPHYLECRQDGLIIYPREEFVPKEQIDSLDSGLSRLIAEVGAKSDREYLIVAVRPNGIDVFKQVRRLIENQGIDIGYEPIDEGWKLKIKQ